MKKLIAVYLFCCLLLFSGSFAFADAVIYNKLSVDSSNCDNGTIKASLVNPKPDTRYKLGVTLGGEEYYYYDLEPDKEYVIPLQLGDGTYQLTLFQNVRDDKYKIVSKAKVEAAPDPNRVWLEPNVKVNFTSSDIVDKLNDELEKSKVCSSDPDSVKFKVIANYVRDYFFYDEVLRLLGHIPQDPYVDLNYILTARMGLCEDMSALTVAMLRLEGVPSRIVFGRANNISHAWVEAFVDGEIKRFDPTASDTRQKKATYIPERYY